MSVVPSGAFRPAGTARRQTDVSPARHAAQPHQKKQTKEKDGSLALGLGGCGFRVGPAVLATTPSRASIIYDASFSFDNVGAPPAGGTIAGTVTGELLGLSYSGSGKPSDIIIYTMPDTLINNEGSLPLDTAAWTFSGGTFTTLNGVITAATNVIDTSPDGEGLLRFNVGIAKRNELSLNFKDAGIVYVSNVGGFGGVTYGSLVAESLPEPASVLVMLPILGFWLCKRQRTAAV